MTAVQELNALLNLLACDPDAEAEINNATKASRKYWAGDEPADLYALISSALEAMDKVNKCETLIEKAKQRRESFDEDDQVTVEDLQLITALENLCRS